MIFEATPLHRRLILIFIVVAAVVTIGALAAMIGQARSRVVAERSSAADLAEQLIDATIADLPIEGRDPMERLARMVDSLPSLRHVRLLVQRPGGDNSPPATHSRDTPPLWFSDLVRPAPWQKQHAVTRDGQPVGEVVIVGNPDDEIAELWGEMRFGVGLLLALMTVFVIVVSWLVSRALRPLALLSQGLDRLGSGDFTTSLPSFDAAELKDVGVKFNNLAKSLQQISGDNRFLIGQLISLQESERKTLAGELHDELGPCLFGIKAQAAFIVRPAPGTVAEDHAKTILSLVDDMQSLNRRILRRLRPIALGELGLGAAIGQLVEDWQIRAPEIEWSWRIAKFATQPDESLALTAYRVVQECLTNSARHSAATKVIVEIDTGHAHEFPQTRWHGMADDAVLQVVVRDDGRGFAQPICPGFGLLGIQERVESIGGVVEFGNGDGDSAQIVVLLPLIHKSGECPGEA